jgi:RecB family exonuclease
MRPEPLRTELLPSFTFSQSSLQDYADCPWRFRLRYIDRLVWPAVESEPALENERRQVEGQLFHRLVQQHQIGLPVDTLTRLANTPELSRWWWNYLKALEKTGLRDNENPCTELSLSAPIGDHRLIAKYDLVAHTATGKIVIYDWKTYRKRPRDEWMASRLQRKVYQAMLVLSGARLNDNKPIPPEQVEMIYWYPEFPTEPACFPYTAQKYELDLVGLTGLIQEIANRQDFPLTDDERKCTYCHYRSYCERGWKAGATTGFDAETADASAAFTIDFDEIAEIEF